jgi:hypothetical protein
LAFRDPSPNQYLSVYGSIPLFPRRGAPERQGFWLVLAFCLVLIAIGYAVPRRFRIPP